MNNSSMNFFLSYILENKMNEILKINRNRLCLLGVDFPINVNETGSIIEVNNIELDTYNSGRLTYEVWSLDCLNSHLIQEKEDAAGRILQLRKKSIRLLISVLTKLSEITAEIDVSSFIENIKSERLLIRDSLYKLSKQK
ncbi:MAG TPA: hypothetical protein VNS58_16840 [Puia sp.]|nr:hypothetical protein [Puia sp.]